jgi:predicted flavoprotein YhiN
MPRLPVLPGSHNPEPQCQPSPKPMSMVLGAGAAGHDLCAIEAGRRGLSVTVIDHAKCAGGENPHLGRWTVQFHQSALRARRISCRATRALRFPRFKSFTQHDFIDRVKARGIAYHEKTLGQLFCDNSARDIINMLTDDMREAGRAPRAELPGLSKSALE